MAPAARESVIDGTLAFKSTKPRITGIVLLVSTLLYILCLNFLLFKIRINNFCFQKLV